MMGTQIEEVRKAEQDILDEFHDFCIANNLRYSLAFGTLLGAKRHGGFIPWDDDVDVMLPREDYEKLLNLWNDKEHDGFILLDDNKCKDSVNNFAKIKKDHTTFLVTRDVGRSFHKGIYIDIFPVDRVAPGRIRKILQYVACAVNLLYSRGYTSGTGGIIGLVEHILLATNPDNYPKRKRKAQQFVCRWNENESLNTFVFDAMADIRKYCPSDMFSNLGTIKFNGKEYCAVSDVDAYLEAMYGDYMQLPPEEERVWRHAAIVLDTEHNFEELPAEVISGIEEKYGIWKPEEDFWDKTIFKYTNKSKERP